MASHVIKRIHHVWKAAETEQMIVESIPISDMESLRTSQSNLLPMAGDPCVFCRHASHYEVSMRKALIWTQVCFPAASTHCSSYWKLGEQTHAPSVGPRLGQDEDAQSGQGQFTLERRALK